MRARLLVLFVATVSALLATAAASLLDCHSTPACDCENVVVLERQRLDSEHMRVLEAVGATYKSRITELEGLVAALGESAPGSAATGVDRSIGTPKQSPSNGAITLIASHGAARTLLQEVSSAEPSCSMGELMAVQANPITAVVELSATNPSCAICLMPCGSAADAVSCAMSCLKQARCVPGPFQLLYFAGYTYPLLLHRPSPAPAGRPAPPPHCPYPCAMSYPFALSRPASIHVFLSYC
jgi:hypothetical protein